MAKRKPTSRREFARQITATTLTTASALAATRGDVTAAQSSDAAKSPSLEQAYFEHVHARFGAQLSAEQLAQIKKDIAGDLRAKERLRAVELKNSDEPDFVFGA